MEENLGRPIGPKPDYASLAAHVRDEVEKRTSRSNPRDELHCSCECCRRASSRGGRNSQIPVSDFFPEGKKKKRGPPTNKPKPDLTPVKICPKCQQVIGRGKPHPCTERSKGETFEETISPRSKASIAHDFINEQLAEANENGESSVSLQSKRGGRPLKIVPENAIKEKTVTITKEMMTRFRLEMDIGN